MTVQLLEFLLNCLVVAVVFFVLGRFVFSKRSMFDERGDELVDGNPIARGMVKVVLFFPIAAMTLSVAAFGMADDPLHAVGWLLIPIAAQVGSHLELLLRLGHR